MLRDGVWHHPRCCAVRVHGPEIDDAAPAQITNTVTTLESQRLLTGHDFRDCSNAQHRPFDVRFKRFGEDVHFHVRGSGAGEVANLRESTQHHSNDGHDAVFTPALLTLASIRPNSSTADCTIASTLASSVISTCRATALNSGCFANLPHSSTTFKAPSWLISATTTPLTLASANAIAVSLPIPAAACIDQLGRAAETGGLLDKPQSPKLSILTEDSVP